MNKLPLSFLLLLLGLLSYTILPSQGTAKIMIDAEALLAEAANSSPISKEDLTAHGWVHVQTNIQHYNHYGDEGPFYEEIEEYNYVYHLKEDGEFEIDAIIDTDGSWKYDEATHHLVLASNFRDYLSKDCIIYMPEKNKLIWYENFNEDPDNAMFFIYIFDAEK